MHGIQKISSLQQNAEVLSVVVRNGTYLGKLVYCMNGSA